MITSSENMARLPPFFEVFASARGAAKGIFVVIDRKSQIDATSSEGKVLESVNVKGNIEFKDVFFKYPSRPDVLVNTIEFYI